jgi:hypothetical protein
MDLEGIAPGITRGFLQPYCSTLLSYDAYVVVASPFFLPRLCLLLMLLLMVSLFWALRRVLRVA